MLDKLKKAINKKVKMSEVKDSSEVKEDALENGYVEETVKKEVEIKVPEVSKSLDKEVEKEEENLDEEVEEQKKRLATIVSAELLEDMRVKTIIISSESIGEVGNTFEY
jgi:DNA primase large subunit